MRNLNRLLHDLKLKDILKDIVSNTITGIILIYLGSIEPLNSVIRKITKSLNEYEITVQGKVLDIRRKPIMNAIVSIPDHVTGKTDKEGNYKLKIKYQKDEKYIIVKVTYENYEKFDRVVETSEFLDKNKIQVKDVTLVNIFD